MSLITKSIAESIIADLIADVQNEDISIEDLAEKSNQAYAWYEDTYIEEKFVDKETLEELLPQSTPFPSNHQLYEAPYKSDKEKASNLIMRCFPESERFRALLWGIISEYDKRTMDEFNENLERLCPYASDRQINFLKKLLRDERFGDDLKEVVKSIPNAWTDRKACRTATDAVIAKQRELQKEFLTDSEYKDIDSLFKRATGKALSEDWTQPQIREMVNRSNFNSVKRMLNEFIQINQKIKDKQEWEEKERQKYLSRVSEKAQREYYDGFTLREDFAKARAKDGYRENDSFEEATTLLFK